MCVDEAVTRVFISSSSSQIVFPCNEPTDENGVPIRRRPPPPTTDPNTDDDVFIEPNDGIPDTVAEVCV